MAKGESARWWWIVPSATLLVVLTLALVFGKDEKKPRSGTTYDAGTGGFLAAYLLLEELSFPVERSRRLTQGQVRMLLEPTADSPRAQILGDWVRAGNVLILADSAGDFAKAMGLKVEVKTHTDSPEIEKATGEGIGHLAAGTVRLDYSGQIERVWVEAGDKPAVTVDSLGVGKIWLLNRPQLFTNKNLKQADNAVLLARLAETVLAEHQGPLYVDEYFHGMRDRPGVIQLLFEPPATWITVQSGLFLGILLWYFVPRFGTAREVAPPARRSRQEFLEAMASLLERKGDAADAYQAVRDDVLRDMEAELGLPGATHSAEVIEEAHRRRRLSEGALARLRTARLAARAGSGALLEALNQLESARDEFFRGQHYR
jgi:hypothetical protein